VRAENCNPEKEIGVEAKRGALGTRKNSLEIV